MAALGYFVPPFFWHWYVDTYNQTVAKKLGRCFYITKTIVNLAKDSIKLLENRKVDDFGKMLDETWQIKKTLAANISNPEIDEMYDLAMRNGALGGKILGAGGGGYLLVYCPDKRKTDLLTAMKDYERLPIKFTNQGSTVEMRS
jgi:galactokinase/mevalonate kinase-like predicted kinase